MSEYQVTIYEQVTHTVEVEAEDEHEALGLAYMAIDEGSNDVDTSSEYTGYFEVVPYE